MPPLPLPTLGRAVLAVDADGVRVGCAVRPARGRRQAGLRADAEECRRGGRDLPPARRPAAGDRAGGGARQDPAARRSAGAHRAAARSADRRRPRSAGAPADAAPDHQVELRPADAAPSRSSFAACRSSPAAARSKAAEAVCNATRGSRRGRARRHRRARGQQPARAARVRRRRAAVPDARDVPRVRPRAAARARRGVVRPSARTPRTCSSSPRKKRSR